MSLATTLPSGGVVIMRNSQEYGGPSQMPTGTSTVLLQDGDPDLGNALTVYSTQYKTGVWTSPNSTYANGSGDYLADHCADLVHTHGLKILAVDVEYNGMGVQGTTGWKYNNDLVSRLAATGTLDALELFAVIPLPLLGDPNTKTFNYDAYVGVGGQVWPQCYGGNSNQNLFDIPTVINTAIARGAPANLTMPIVCPGQFAPTYAHAGVYGPPPYYRGDYFGTNATPTHLTDAQAKTTIEATADQWQADRTPYPGARITLAGRLCKTGPEWATIGPQVKQLLDNAGSPT